MSASGNFAPLRNWAQTIATNYKRILRNRRRRTKQTKDPILQWNIVRGDLVEILSGKDAGKQGRVLKVDRKRHRVYVEGAHMNYRISAPTETQAGGMYKAEAPIHYSNVNLVDPVTGKHSRVSTLFKEDGTRVRVAKRSGTPVPKPDSLKERAVPRPSTVGPLDTAPKDVQEVTYAGIEAEYENWRTMQAERRQKLVQKQGLLHKYIDKEFQVALPDHEREQYTSNRQQDQSTTQAVDAVER